jgi:muramoyltetrapeptide carboxypeptidase
MPIKPGRLQYGDTVGIITPASAPPDPKSIDRCAAAVERLGFKPWLAPHVRQRRGFLAGSDRDRAGDLMGMFTNRRVRAIFCVRGGYGTARLLSRLDYAMIRANPKILVGHSDITSLHLGLLRKANLVTFHGPMPHSDLMRDDMPDFTRENLLRVLMKAEPPGSIGQGCREARAKTLRRGKAVGRLIGGNLSVLCATMGTPFQPSLKGRILFFEDLAEPPYRFDRMLTQLLNSGALQQTAGIAIGTNRNCEDPGAKKSTEYRQTLEEVLAERLRPLGVPVVCGLPFGHVRHNATLPLGVRATLDADNAELVITEAAVS